MDSNTSGMERRGSDVHGPVNGNVRRRPAALANRNSSPIILGETNERSSSHTNTKIPLSGHQSFPDACSGRGSSSPLLPSVSYRGQGNQPGRYCERSPRIGSRCPASSLQHQLIVLLAVKTRHAGIRADGLQAGREVRRRQLLRNPMARDSLSLDPSVFRPCYAGHPRIEPSV